MKDEIFGILQRIGRSFMLPIALLPAAGLLLGVGSSLTNTKTLETYNLTSVIYPGGLLYTILDIMSQCGSAVFGNLALLFAMGVAIGMAKKEKEVAALSSAIAYLVMNTAIAALITAHGGVDAMPPNSTASVLGITTIQMGVFGGIVTGLGVAALHNRFYKTELPQALSFFGGTRFVPIVCTAVFVAVGAVMFFVWPFVQIGIAAIGDLVIRSGYIGTWIYGIMERVLLPFGLHHVLHMPFWQTALGGTAVIDGVTVQGAQNIFFAELASRSTQLFSVSATRFLAGAFPFMIFGLPGAALAMYRTAKPERRKIVGGLFFSAALASILTGITEPIEFTFLFAAPIMYAVHCVYAGLSYMLMHILNVGVGMTFSGGIIDLTLFGILQGAAKTHWYWIVVVGVFYFLLYYFTFYFMIIKMNLKTPGREDEGEETKLFTRDDFKAKTGIGLDGSGRAADSDSVSALILKGLGGKNNISDIDACATRLRITVADPGKVSESALKQSGASGVICNGNGVQVIYGPQVSVIKSNLVDFMETPESDSCDSASAATPASAAPAKPEAANTKDEILVSHLNGVVVPLAEVSDEAFAEGFLGKGVAVEPSEGRLFAPADGVVDRIFDTNYAVTLTTDSGAEILLHIGIDTIKLGGRYFEAHVSAAQHVKKGDLLISFDIEEIRAAGYLTTTPMIVCNSDDYSEVKQIAYGEIKAGTPLLEIKA
ncbi:MAG: PTS transporter subunit EIIC [Synergistes sp.]|nr:PTS transporter subunit EIIC [Synergistes sp.]